MDKISFLFLASRQTGCEEKVIDTKNDLSVLIVLIHDEKKHCMKDFLFKTIHDDDKLGS